MGLDQRNAHDSVGPQEIWLRQAGRLEQSIRAGVKIFEIARKIDDSSGVAISPFHVNLFPVHAHQLAQHSFIGFSLFWRLRDDVHVHGGGFPQRHTAMRSRTHQFCRISCASMYDSRLRSICSATWRSASSRKAIRFPRRKKFFSERSTFSALYTSPRRMRFNSASGVKSTMTVSAAVSGTQSGTVSRTIIPVIERTVGAMLSMC